MQNQNSKVQSKEENRQERQEKHRLDRQAEIELEMKRLDRLAQADADRLDLKKRKAERQDRLIDTEMQAKKLQNQTQALQSWKDEIKTIMETKKELIQAGLWDDMSVAEQEIFKCLLNLTFIKELQFTQNYIRYVNE
jgi:hypothetical protein